MRHCPGRRSVFHYLGFPFVSTVGAEREKEQQGHEDPQVRSTP